MPRTLQLPAGTIAYDVHGAGPPILLLHSAGHDRRDFDGLIGPLAERHAVHALDLPGFGESSAADPDAVTAWGVADAVRDFVRALDLAPVVAVGNSVGGLAALRLAAREPRRVRGIVLVDPGGFTEHGAVTRAFCRVQGVPWIRRATGHAFARWYVRDRGPASRAMLERVREAEARDDVARAHASLWRSFAEPGSDGTEDARAVSCPTLLAWGTRDPVSRADVEGRRARALLPHARWAPFDCGHVPFVERPAEFLAELLPFLAGLPAAERADAHA